MRAKRRFVQTAAVQSLATGASPPLGRRGYLLPKAGGLWQQPLAAVALILGLLTVGLACEEGVVPGNPLLPVGFADTQVPQVPLSAYLYINQGEAITFTTAHFLDEETLDKGQLLSLPETVGLDALRMWAGPSMGSFGALFDYASAQEAQVISQFLQLQQEGLQGVWHRQEADQFSLVNGSDAWATSLRDALEQGRGVALEEEYPEVWETVRMLPENPPSQPVAAGFIRLDEELIESFASKAGIEAPGMAPAAGFMRIKAIAFAVYTDAPLVVGDEVNQSYFTEAQVSGVFVARSSYPGFLISLALSILSSRTALEEVSLNEDTSAFYLPLDQLHLMVSHQGSVVFGSLAPSRERAQELLASALGVGS